MARAGRDRGAPGGRGRRGGGSAYVAHWRTQAASIRASLAALGVGLQGLAVAERALQRAEAYAHERQQGRAVGAPPGAQSPIVAHPDVRRTLLEARAQVDAMRALCYANAHALDLAQHAADPDERGRQHRLADLLTPLSKAWSTDLGVELSSEALQVFGGMGYVEETGVAQQFRDARIAPIYEGTNGIQAIDLVGRKLPMEDGGLVARVLDGLVADLEGAPDDVADLVGPVVEAAALARDLAAERLAMRDDPRDALAGATPYLRVLATVIGTALVVRGVVAAERARAAGGAVDASVLEARTARARVLVRRVLPRIHGLAPAVRAGAADLYAAGTPAA